MNDLLPALSRVGEFVGAEWESDPLKLISFAVTALLVLFFVGKYTLAGGRRFLGLFRGRPLSELCQSLLDALDAPGVIEQLGKVRAKGFDVYLTDQGLAVDGSGTSYYKYPRGTIERQDGKLIGDQFTRKERKALLAKAREVGARLEEAHRKNEKILTRSFVKSDPPKTSARFEDMNGAQTPAPWTPAWRDWLREQCGYDGSASSTTVEIASFDQKLYEQLASPLPTEDEIAISVAALNAARRDGKELRLYHAYKLPPSAAKHQKAATLPPAGQLSGAPNKESRPT